MTQITPVLLCGGSGTRLWPLSRKSYPKQFVQLVGNETLFQASARRTYGKTSTLSFENPVTITNNDFRFIVAEQLLEAEIDPGAIIIEPEGRNTAPAVLAAALHVSQGNPDAVVLVASSDHVIPDADVFQSAITKGLASLKEGKMITFGIAATYPETGYGYLELASTPNGTGDPIALKRFVEKPDLVDAEKMIAAGNYRWNAGIFLFNCKDIIAAFEKYQPEMVALVKKAVDGAKKDLGFLRLEPDAWSKADDISIDYAVMEKADNLAVVPFDGAWNDLGGWDAVWRESEPDDAGVVTSTNATAIDCQNTLLRSENESLELVGIGLDNIVAVAMNDAVLVANKDNTQDVKKAVAVLKEKSASQATAFPKDHRPWGWFESLIVGDRFQVKRIVVKPGASLSLQSHFHRSEHWIVVEGTAKVTVDDEVKLISENQSVYIPLGAVHRMENPGKVNMVLIEVQTGAYVGEDDIVRYEDVYARD